MAGKQEKTVIEWQEKDKVEASVATPVGEETNPTSNAEKPNEVVPTAGEVKEAEEAEEDWRKKHGFKQPVPATAVLEESRAYEEAHPATEAMQVVYLNCFEKFYILETESIDRLSRSMCRKIRLSTPSPQGLIHQ